MSVSMSVSVSVSVSESKDIDFGYVGLIYTEDIVQRTHYAESIVLGNKNLVAINDYQRQMYYFVPCAEEEGNLVTIENREELYIAIDYYIDKYNTSKSNLLLCNYMNMLVIAMFNMDSDRIYTAITWLKTNMDNYFDHTLIERHNFHRFIGDMIIVFIDYIECPVCLSTDSSWRITDIHGEIVTRKKIILYAITQFAKLTDIDKAINSISIDSNGWEIITKPRHRDIFETIVSNCPNFTGHIKFEDYNIARCICGHFQNIVPKSYDRNNQCVCERHYNAIGYDDDGNDELIYYILFQTVDELRQITECYNRCLHRRIDGCKCKFGIFDPDWVCE